MTAPVTTTSLKRRRRSMRLGFAKGGLSRTAQLAISVLAVVSLIDVPSEAGLFDGGPADWWKVVALATGYLAVGLAPWRPWWAVGVSAIPLIIPLVHSGGVKPFALVPCLIAVAATASRGQLWALTTAYSAWAVALALVTGNDVWGWGYGVAIFLSVIVGLAIRYFVVERAAARRTVAELQERVHRVRADERDRLARELHDVVAHELSVISLQVMAHGDSDDASQLRAAMARVDKASKAALTELRALVGVLRDLNASHPSSLLDDVGFLSVNRTAERMMADLKAHGFAPLLDLDPRSADLNPTEQTTVARVIQEGTTNILRHARPGSPCTFSIQCTADQVRIRVTSCLASSRDTPLSWQSSGWGLHGLRERVELTGGYFEAGPADDSWILTVNLHRES
ncbi:sensor histidine kinase [Micropruina sp.]|uniref:sensor histidine kinase n=1 Tax=Micropruina sp. TaxID=2737536 RepID=UPI0039E710EF